MDIRKVILPLVLFSSLTTALFSGTARGERLLSEAGGAEGIAGVAGPAGAPGLAGAAGAAGIQGVPGIPGAPGLLDFSDFYAILGPSQTVATGAPVLFPFSGPTNGTINRQGGVSSSVFILPAIGTYLVQFQASIGEGGPGSAQLQLEINGVADPNSVVGRATGTDQVVGKSLVTTTVPNTTLRVLNPSNNTTTLTLTTIAGGPNAVSAHLTIIRLQ